MKKIFSILILMLLLGFSQIKAQNDKKQNIVRSVQGDYVALCQVGTDVDIVCIGSQGFCFAYKKLDDGTFVGTYFENHETPKSFRAQKVTYSISTLTDVEGNDVRERLFTTLDDSKRYSLMYSGVSLTKTTVFLINSKGEVEAQTVLNKGSGRIEFDLSAQKSGRYFVKAVHTAEDGKERSSIMDIIDVQ